MPDYKTIADMLDILDRHYVDRQDEMLSYLLKMAREHSAAKRPVTTERTVRTAFEV